MKLTALRIDEARVLTLPAAARAAIPTIRAALAAHHSGMEFVTAIPDQFSSHDIKIYVADTETYYQRRFRGQGLFCVDGAGMPFIVYRAPLTDPDTIYHELTHAYDPQYRKLISTTKMVPGTNWQSMTTPHEILAVTTARVDAILWRLRTVAPERRAILIAELSGWLRRPKTDDDFDPWKLPELIRGMSIWHLYANKQLWRQFVSRLYNAIADVKSNHHDLKGVDATEAE